LPELKIIPVGSIRIPDVRVSSILDEEQRALLASTIAEVGVVQDPVVRALPDGNYELIAGRGRISELVALGRTEVQVKVVEADEKMGLVMNVIENVARGSYDYISISQAIRRLKSLGAVPEQLEKIFPWSRRWIDFLEDLQDLPDDVVAAIKARKITPTHVQHALNLPTPYEVHDGLRSAINLGWDTGTFKVFVQNRVDQIARAKAEAAAKGVEPEIPAVNPEQLVQYRQCLVCGYRKPAKEITLEYICEACQTLTRYITDQLGPPEKAIETVYAALQVYFGMRRIQEQQPGPVRTGSSQG